MIIHHLLGYGWVHSDHLTPFVNAHTTVDLANTVCHQPQIDETCMSLPRSLRNIRCVHCRKPLFYRYRETTGSTERAIKALQHLERLGTIRSVVGYQYRAYRKSADGKITVVNHRVKVIGDGGEASFTGFCYGYFGQGPAGLIRLFQKLGVPTQQGTVGYKCAHEIKRSDHCIEMNKPVIDWQLDLFPSGDWLLVHKT